MTSRSTGSISTGPRGLLGGFAVNGRRIAGVRCRRRMNCDGHVIGKMKARFVGARNATTRVGYALYRWRRLRWMHPRQPVDGRPRHTRPSAGGGRREQIHLAEDSVRLYAHGWQIPFTTGASRLRRSPELHGRKIIHPRGKTLGGSSSINGLFQVRGQAGDFDHWRQLGLEGWGWDFGVALFQETRTFRAGRE